PLRRGPRRGHRGRAVLPRALIPRCAARAAKNSPPVGRGEDSSTRCDPRGARREPSLAPAVAPGTGPRAAERTTSMEPERRLRRGGQPWTSPLPSARGDERVCSGPARARRRLALGTLALLALGVDAVARTRPGEPA